MRDTIGVRAIGSKLQAPSAAHAEMIQTALQERRRLDMTYYALSRDEVNRRQVDPYYLTFFDGGFYLIGYCHWRKTERIFAVERIRELKMHTARFEVRPGFNAVAAAPGAASVRVGRLCQGDGGHEGGERRRSVLLMMTRGFMGESIAR